MAFHRGLQVITSSKFLAEIPMAIQNCSRSAKGAPTSL
jgi:hypothetical protein